MWKSVEKVLPPLDCYVLVIGRDQNKQLEPYVYFKRFQSIALYKGNGKFVLKEPLYPYDIKVTHWKTLPEYPEDTFVGKVQALVSKLMKS